MARPIAVISACLLLLLTQQGAAIQVPEPDGNRSAQQRTAALKARLQRELDEVHKSLVAGPNFLVGARVMVLSPTGSTRDCVVLEVNVDKVKVHYEGFDGKFDEWIDVNSDRIAKVKRNLQIGSLNITGIEHCPFFVHAKMLGDELKQVSPATTVNAQSFPDKASYQKWLLQETVRYGEQASHHKTSPFVVVDGKFTGGYTELYSLLVGKLR